ncbi:MAG: hypothetical protein K6G17_09240 [Oscillospiraceae bacterium]|nr:hypothetical protein [Oscillospiraceae bacterium]
MKRVFSFLLLAMLVLSLSAAPALASDGDSKTDPVEIIATVPTETPSPQETGTPGPTGGDTEGGEPGTTPIPDRTLPSEEDTDAEGRGNESWSLANLLCTAGTLAFGGAATVEAAKISRKKLEYRYEDEEYILFEKEKTRTIEGVKTTETEFRRKSKLWKSGRYDLLSGAAAVAALLLTQNFQTTMTLADQWTPLMAGLLAVSGGVFGLTAGGKKLDRAQVEKIKAAGKDTVSAV